MFDNLKRAGLVIFYILVIAVSLLFSFLNLSEYYTVGILQEHAAYPFGQVNENPWYYRSPNTYSTYTLITGILYLTGSILLIAGIIKNRKLIIFSVLFLLIIIIFDTISAGIQ